MQVQVYLFCAGRCEEAVEFYKKTLGAEVMMLMRFKDSLPAGVYFACRGGPPPIQIRDTYNVASNILHTSRT